MLIILGILLCLLMLWLIKTSIIEKGSISASIGLGLCIVIHLTILYFSSLDVGYSWVELSPVDIALNGYTLILLPYAFSLVILFFISIKRFWSSLLLNVLQILIIIPVLLRVELQTSISFLNITIILFLYLSLIASFFMIPSVVKCIPKPGSHWHKVIFSGRYDLINGIKEVAKERSWDYEPAGTILESGRAKGMIAGLPIIIDTIPELIPPHYRISFTVKNIILDPTCLNEITSDSIQGKYFKFQVNGETSKLSYLSTYNIPIGKDYIDKILSAINNSLNRISHEK